MFGCLKDNVVSFGTLSRKSECQILLKTAEKENKLLCADLLKGNRQIRPSLRCECKDE